MYVPLDLLRLWGFSLLPHSHASLTTCGVTSESKIGKSGDRGREEKDDIEELEEDVG